ncbi:MAG: glycosyltransferase 9 family protein [Proteobacteria bacterium]|nr:glycosyltransferase 9 family protein [Pseudomonadota bacterium]
MIIESGIEAMRSSARSAKPTVALVAFDSLGDGLIYLMIAENLRQNGFGVTCYGNIAYQMRHWLPGLNLRNYPQRDQFEREFDAYDLVIMSPPQFLRDTMDEQKTAALREKYLLICQKTPESWRFDHTERLRRTLGAKAFEQLQGLTNCSGSIRFKKFSDESAVEMTLHYMREKMHLENVSKEIRLTPPDGLQFRRHPRRIIVSPDSAGPEKKNWTPSSFIELCHRLKARGYEPEIVVAPKHHSRWANMASNVFATPCFPDIDRLSAHLYESGAVIANDSGNGHLASFLKIPVVTIYRKKNPVFHWRPNWGPGIVVCPALTILWPGGALWKPFVRTAEIVSALEQLLLGSCRDHSA